MHYNSTKRHRWTDADDVLLRERFPHEPTEHLLLAIPGCTVSAIKTRARRLGLTKTEEYRRAYLAINREASLAVIRGRPAWNRKPSITVHCEICGRGVEIWPSHAQRFRCCSRACAAEAKRRITGKEHPLYSLVERICKWCGASFQCKPAKVAYGEGLFCSRSCQGSHLVRSIGKVSAAERRFGTALQAVGLFPRPQSQIGRWTVDFLFVTERLAVEFDGEYWHSLDAVRVRDLRKNEDLRSAGYGLVRVPEKLFRDRPKDAVQLVIDALRGRLT